MKELDKLRKKYRDELSDEYNKKKMPHFFAHISRQKGYYNPPRKNYCKYQTSMDYLQTVINGFRIKNPYKKTWLPLVAILDNGKYHSPNVNQKQINKIYSLIKRFISDRKSLYASDKPKEEKQNEANMLYDTLKSDIDGETIGFSTMFQLLCSLENKDNTQIKNILLQILWACGNNSYSDCIIQSIDEIEQLEEGGNDLKLFNIGYKITKKRLDSTEKVDFHPYS